MKRHSHLAWVGVAGLVVGAAVLVFAPKARLASSSLLVLAGLHLLGLAPMLFSVWVLGGGRLLARLGYGRRSGFDFGWATAWRIGPWVASGVCLLAAVILQVAAARAWWPLAMAATLQAASFFVGGLLARGAGRYAEAFLPMVDLGLAERDEPLSVLDAGCGAGRMTLALGRALRNVRIVAIDRFDSAYIDGGGRKLLEQNLHAAKLRERVTIEAGDLTSLPFADGAFDAVVSAHAIDHLGSGTAQGLREIRRVLKPGGRFLLMVWVRGWAMFSVGSLLALHLSPAEEWRARVRHAGFSICDEGRFPGVWFAVLENAFSESLKV